MQNSASPKLRMVCCPSFVNPWHMVARPSRATTVSINHLRREHGAKGSIDMLDTYIGLHHAKPDVIGPHHVTELGLMVGFAGSESTSSALGALTYLVISHRKVYNKLVAEVRDPANFPLGTTTISYAAASKLPYFDACVKEMFRLHPPGGAIMERVVPPGGAHIAGHDIPAGTIVGCNARPVQRDPKVFGPDPDAFRPERWLSGEDASDAEKQKVNEMWAAMLHFGAGKHTCMGKNISLLEIYKIAVALFREFEVSIQPSLFLPNTLLYLVD